VLINSRKNANDDGKDGFGAEMRRKPRSVYLLVNQRIAAIFLSVSVST